ncbi:MAG: response regulator transcription factor [Chloroflexota bacterium]|nr:response regulator transcription factor [Chloroflexota bacterium]
MTEPIRVIVTDDHPLVRAGIRAVLEAEPDIEVVGEAASGEETKRLCQELMPDILLLDMSMPGPTPLEIVTFLDEHCPSIKVLVVSAYDDDSYVGQMAAAGVAGYLLKHEATDVVAGAIRTIEAGGSWFSRAIVEKMATWSEGPPASHPLSTLTERERQVLELLAEGKNPTQIADELHLAVQTIRNYLTQIYQKIGIHNRVEAVLWAREQGLGRDSEQ